MDYTPKPEAPPDRLFHLRWSSDPIILDCSTALAGSLEARELINRTPPDTTGDAAAILDAYHAVCRAAHTDRRRLWISIRDATTHRTTSLEEIRLIAALFCGEKT
jgi:hypothetical protein